MSVSQEALLIGLTSSWVSPGTGTWLCLKETLPLVEVTSHELLGMSLQSPCRNRLSCSLMLKRPCACGAFLAASNASAPKHRVPKHPSHVGSLLAVTLMGCPGDPLPFPHQWLVKCPLPGLSHNHCRMRRAAVGVARGLLPARLVFVEALLGTASQATRFSERRE